MLRTVFFGTLVAAISVAILLLIFLPTPTPELNNDATAGQAPKQSTQVRDETSFAVRNVTVFTGEELFEAQDVLVENGRITAIGEALNLTDGLFVIEGDGKTLIPGLVDAHTHSWNIALVEALQYGVTTNIDMYTQPDLLKATRPAREKQGKTNEAALYSAGMLGTAPRGHGTQFGNAVDTLKSPEEAQEWVDKRLAEGSDFIKIVYNPYINFLPSIDRPIAKAIIDAAHARNVMVVAHISTVAEARDVVEDGIDGLVHIFADKPVSEDFINLALEKEIFIVPTLAVLSAVVGEGSVLQVRDDPAIAPYLFPSQHQSLSQAFPSGNIAGFNFDIAMSNVAALHKAGVPILAGSDAPNPGTAHGVSLHHEMALLVEAGMTPIEALKAATALPATIFNVNTGGVLRVGEAANMVLLNGDVSSSITSTRKIDTIWRNGYAVTRKTSESRAGNRLSSSELGNFETDLSTPSNLRWVASTDAIVQGTSSASLSRTSPGANGSEGALQVDATIETTFPFPWAGASIIFSNDFTKGYSIEEFATMSFDIKGTPGQYRVMMFNTGVQGNPPTQFISVTNEWQRISLPLNGFPGLTPKNVSGLAIVSGPQPGSVSFMIDNVRFE